MITLSENTKKILFGVFFVAFTVATGYALYYFFFRTETPAPTETVTPQGYEGELGTSGPRTPTEGETVTETGTLPEAGVVPTGEATAEGTTGGGTVNLLRDAVTQAVSRSPSGDMRFYDPDTGRFYRMSPTGGTTQLSDKQFYNLQNITWGKSGDQAILEFPDNSKVYYDFEADRQYSLPSHWQDFDFSPNDDTVVAKSLGLDQNNRFLITSNADGNESTALYHLGDNEALVTPSWSPNNQVIGFSQTGTPQPDGAEQILLLGKNHENFKALIVAGHGFQPNWSPTGKSLLYSVYHERDENKPMLWISDAMGNDIGRNRKKLNLNTWADKCAWKDENNLYCAVPMDLPAGSGFNESSFTTVPDDIYRIDLKTGVAKKISDSTQNLPVINPTFNKDKTQLVFTDGSTGKLYSYKLKD